MSNIYYKQLTIENPDGEIIYCKHEDNNSLSLTIPDTSNNISNNTNNTSTENITPSSLTNQEYNFIAGHVILIEIIIFMDIISDLNYNNDSFIYYLDLVIDIIGFYSASSFCSNIFLIYLIKYYIITIFDIYLSYYCNFHIALNYNKIANNNNNIISIDNINEVINNNNVNEYINNCIIINIAGLTNLFISIILYRFYLKLQVYFNIFNMNLNL